MSKKTSDKGNSNIFAGVDFATQWAAMKLCESMNMELGKFTAFHSSFERYGNKQLELLGPKGKIICNKLIEAFMSDMQANDYETKPLYAFLRSLPSKLYTEQSCDLLFRSYRLSEGAQGISLTEAIKGYTKHLPSNYALTDAKKIEAIFVLVEGLTALIWSECGTTLTPIKDQDQYRRMLGDLVTRGIIHINSEVENEKIIFNLLNSISNDLIPAASGTKKGGTKKNSTTSNPPIANDEATSDAAELLKNM